ncbi:MAG: DUF7079 family protein [Formosimonas sp.]
MLTESEILRRQPVWAALSELWLDSPPDLEWIARCLRESGYSLSELDAIYANEVAPVVYRNLHAIIGVWGGFDPKWLYENAQYRAEHCRPTRGLRRWWVTRGTQDDWQQLVQLIQARHPN